MLESCLFIKKVFIQVHSLYYSTFIIDFFVCFHNLASLELEIRLGKRLMSLSKQASWKNLKRYYENELQSTVT